MQHNSTSQASVESGLKQVFEDLGFACNTVFAETSLEGFDMLDKVDLIMEVEDYFAVEISDAEAEPWKTANDIIACVTNKLHP